MIQDQDTNAQWSIHDFINPHSGSEIPLTSGDIAGQLPQFEGIASSRNQLGFFRRIFRDEGWIPILIELSIIHDRDTPTLGDNVELNGTAIGESDYFTTHLVSYVDGSDDWVLKRDSKAADSIKEVWLRVISKLTKGGQDRATSNVVDVVPNVKTYENVFCAVPFSQNGWSGGVSFPGDPGGQTPPIIPTVLKFAFRPPKDEAQLNDLPKTLNMIVNEFRKELDLDSNDAPTVVGQSLNSACLAAVPFFRMIRYDSPMKLKELLKLTGDRNAGGCLLAVLLPSPELTNAAMKLQHIRRACVRISWLLNTMAFSEAYTKQRADDVRLQTMDTILRKASHAIASPLRPIKTELPDIEAMLDDLISRTRDPVGDRLLHQFAIFANSMKIAFAAARCIEAFVKLSPERPAKEREVFIQSNLRGDYVDLSVIATEIREGPLFNNTDDNIALRIAYDGTGPGYRVIGNRDAWLVVLYMLLKNAKEHTAQMENTNGHSEKGEVTLTLSADPVTVRLTIVIRNKVPKDWSKAALESMNDAIQGAVHSLEFNDAKETSFGVGLSTVCMFLDAWRIPRKQRTFHIDLNTGEVVLTITDIPFTS